MILPAFATDTITVVTPLLVDDRGTMVPDWSGTPVSSVDVTGCSVQPGTSDEALLARQNVSIRWTVFAPPTVVVTARSGVRFGGVLYQVDGEPQRWLSPTGTLDHVVILLVDFQG